MHLTPFTIRLGLIALVLGLVIAVAGRCEEAAAPAPASEPATEEVSEPEESWLNLPLKTYNVHDLLCTRDVKGMRDWVTKPLKLTETTMGFELFRDHTNDDPNLQRTLSADELQLLLMRTVNHGADRGVAPWSEEGGPAAMEYLPGVLIISQTTRGHERVQQALDLLRKQWRPSRILVVQAQWVLMAPGKVKELLDEAAATADLPFEVTDEALQKAGATVVHEGVMTCINGHTAFVESAKALAAPAPKKDEDVLANPISEGRLSETFLQVRPTLLDEHTVAVDVLAEVIEANAPHITAYNLQNNLIIPLGKTVLLGGITAPNNKTGKAQYLILKVTASEGAEDLR